MPNIAATLSLNVPAITALCKGDPGTSILSGPLAPTLVIGNDGDFYIETAMAGYTLYGPKTAGLWGVGTTLTNSASADIWNIAYSLVRANSAEWISTFTTVTANSASWGAGGATFTLMNQNSANWISSYTTMTANSASWSLIGNGSGLTVVSQNSANWDSVYTTVYNESASWIGGGGGGGDPFVNALVRSNSSFWQGTYTVTQPFSSQWGSAYNYLNDPLGNPGSGPLLQGGPLSGKFEAVYSTVYSNSAGWEADNGAAGTLAAASGRWENTWTQMHYLSAPWQSTAGTVSALSANWDQAYDGLYNTASGVATFSAVQWNLTYANIFGPGPSTGPSGGLAQLWNAAYNWTVTGVDVWTAAQLVLYLASLTGVAPGYVSQAYGTVNISNGWFDIPLSACNGAVSAIGTNSVHLTACIPHYSGTQKFPIGYTVDIIQGGTLTIQVSAGNNNILYRKTSIQVPPTPGFIYTNGQYSTIKIRKTSDDGSRAEWVVSGDTKDTYP